MPDLDFLILCDHVRPDQGTLHILAAGIDQMHIAPIPALAPLGVAARLSFASEDADSEHSAEIRILGPQNDLVFEARGVVLKPAAVPGMPPGWASHLTVTSNILVPIQSYGPHAVTFIVDGEALKTMSFFVAPPQGA